MIGPVITSILQDNRVASLQVRQVLEAHPEGSVKLHEKKTVVVMEGPAFSTRAESVMYRQIGVSSLLQRPDKNNGLREV